MVAPEWSCYFEVVPASKVLLALRWWWYPGSLGTMEMLASFRVCPGTSTARRSTCSQSGCGAASILARRSMRQHGVLATFSFVFFLCAKHSKWPTKLDLCLHGMHMCCIFSCNMHTRYHADRILCIHDNTYHSAYNTISENDCPCAHGARVYSGEFN